MDTIKAALTTLPDSLHDSTIHTLARYTKHIAAPAHMPKWRGQCWLWTGGKHEDGYGLVHVKPPVARVMGAHRAAWLVLRGDIDLDHDGTPLTLDHLCRVKACTNPWHLEPVTRAENTRRAAALITACPRGHDYTEENTRVTVDRNGHTHRHCRACASGYQRDYLARKAARKAGATAAGADALAAA